MGPNASIHHPKDATDRLEKLERETGMLELDPVYEEIYQMNTVADSESRNIAVRTYKWILSAQRQLHIEELADAVCYSTDGVPDSAVTSDLILKICSNFLFVDASQVVQFSHLSAREYLEKRESNSVRDYSSIQIHTQAAISCLALLNHTDINEVSSFTKGLGFPGYAVVFWMVHLQMSCENRELPPLDFMAKDFVLNAPRRRSAPFFDWIDVVRRGDLANSCENFEQRPRLLATDSYPPNPLFLLCVWGFHEILKVSSGRMDLTQLNVEKKSALWIASKYGNYDVALWLLDQGVDCDAITGTHGSALQAAAGGGHERVVKLLLERGAAPNFRDDFNTSALGAAARGGYESIFRLLFEIGADHGDYGDTLRCAAAGGNRHLIKMLIDQGTDVDSPNKHGGRPLEEAAYRGRKVAVEILLEHGANVNAAGGAWGCALSACAVGGHAAIAEVLLTHGANANAVGGLWGSALHAAAGLGYPEVMKVLLAHGADINVQGVAHGTMPNGTPLIKAAEVGRKESVLFLLEHGADINMPGGIFEYKSPLQAAIYGGDGHNTSIVKLLLENGAVAYPNAGDYNFELHIASEGGNIEVVRMLLDLGADVNFQHGTWGTPLQASARWGRPRDEAVANLLLERGAQVNTTDLASRHLRSALEAAAFAGNLTFVQLLLDRGARIADSQSDFGSALIAAATGGHEAIVQLLLGKGADVGFQTGRIGSALHAAAEQAMVKTVQLLIMNGADVNREGGEYHSALQAAAFSCERKVKDGLEVLKTLLNNGAEVNKQGGKFGSALQAAAFSCSTEAVRLLISEGANINVSGGLFGSVLQAAASPSHYRRIHPYVAKEFPNYSTVETLLELGADANTEGGLHGSALQAAALVGNENVVRLLLENGADVHVKGGQCGTALQAALRLGPSEDEFSLAGEASESWFHSIIQMLLDHGAVVEEGAMDPSTSADEEEIVAFPLIEY
jgi:ankyrin repeat protein